MLYGRTPLPSKSIARLQIPKDTLAAWERLADGSGSQPDIDRIVKALDRMWSFASADPKAFDEWLSDLGIRKEFASRDVMLKAKSEFDAYQEIKRGETARLARGIASGSHIQDFFRRLKASSTELRRIFFEEALHVCTDDNLVFIFVLLASEDANLTRSLLHLIPPSAISGSFLRFLRSRGSEWAKLNEFRTHLSASRERTNLEPLFDILALPYGELQEHLRNGEAPEVKKLLVDIERLFPHLPTSGYGGFLRQKLLVVALLADPQHPLADQAVPLVSEGGAEQIELLQYVSPNRLVGILRNLIANNKNLQTALTAAVLDELRTNHSNFLSDLSSEILRLEKSRDHEVSFSARAAAVYLKLIDEKDFERSLVRALASDKKKSVVKWLARNPEFLRTLPPSKLTGRIFAEILEALLATNPPEAIRFLRQIFLANDRPLDRRSWTAAMKVLGGAQNQFADEVFVELAARALRENTQTAEDLSRETAGILLSKNIWTLALRCYDANTWNVIFDAISPTLTSSSILTWLQGSPAGRTELQNWIRSEFIPRLFEIGNLSADFLASLPDSELKREFTLTLCEAAARRLENIKSVTREWAARTSSRKKALVEKISVGLKIATDLLGANQALHARLRAIGEDLRAWQISNSPLLDAEIVSVSDLQFPRLEHESPEILDLFFAKSPPSSHSVPLFFASNPWSIHSYFYTDNRSWPKFNLIAPQIVRSLVYLSQLDGRAIKAAEQHEDNLKIDLAMTLRENMDQIEETITGYFILRDVLNQIGLEPVESGLGSERETDDLLSEMHKVIRDASRKGKLRVFGLGFRVRDKVVANSRVMASGEHHDRD